ncbi:hypothetical protein [Pantoea agglomerans]|uniref:hypothetical protein n=1 Tax=Enterobacter agglomerans TaxID=549 RepID=UPI0017868060|nr:hypothetical protein [Pantoea agglomerans]MBD8133185.1 hypothetical protein [Pantoea agglomerans]
MKAMIQRWHHADNRDHLYLVLIAVMLAANFTLSGLTMREGLPGFPGFPGWQVWRLALLTSPVIVLLAYLCRNMAVLTFGAMVLFWLILAAYYFVKSVWFWMVPVPHPIDILFMAAFTTGIAYFLTLFYFLLNLR